METVFRSVGQCFLAAGRSQEGRRFKIVSSRVHFDTFNTFIRCRLGLCDAPFSSTEEDDKSGPVHPGKPH